MASLQLSGVFWQFDSREANWRLLSMDAQVGETGRIGTVVRRTDRPWDDLQFRGCHNTPIVFNFFLTLVYVFDMFKKCSMIVEDVHNCVKTEKCFVYESSIVEPAHVL